MAEKFAYALAFAERIANFAIIRYSVSEFRYSELQIRCAYGKIRSANRKYASVYIANTLCEYVPPPPLERMVPRCCRKLQLY